MAKFDQCVNLPPPASTQAVDKRSDCNGCYYSLRTRHKQTGERDNSALWNVYTKLPIKTLNRHLTRGLALYWTNSLSAAQRAQWETEAAGASWTNYDGQPSTPNGFEYFVAYNRTRRYYLFDPRQNGARLFLGAGEIAAGYTVLFPITTAPAWAVIPTPTAVIQGVVIDTHPAPYVWFSVPNIPDNFNYDIDCVISITHRTMCGPTPSSYIHTYNSGVFQQGGNDYGACYLDYPGPPVGLVRHATVGVRYRHLTSHIWSDFQWLAVS
jgi:hypothetical protein